MPPPVLVHVDSRQKKRTMIKNAYQATHKKEALITLPVPLVQTGPTKPSARDQNIPQSVLDQHSAGHNNPSIGSHPKGSQKGSSKGNTEVPVTATEPIVAATASVAVAQQPTQTQSRRPRELIQSKTPN